MAQHRPTNIQIDMHRLVIGDVVDGASIQRLGDTQRIQLLPKLTPSRVGRPSCTPLGLAPPRQHVVGVLNAREPASLAESYGTLDAPCLCRLSSRHSRSAPKLLPVKMNV